MTDRLDQRSHSRWPAKQAVLTLAITIALFLGFEAARAETGWTDPELWAVRAAIASVVLLGANLAALWRYTHLTWQVVQTSEAQVDNNRRQLEEATRSRHLESVLGILRYIDDIVLRRARYFMYEHITELRPLLEAPFSWDNRRALDTEIRRLSKDSVELHHIDLWINSLNNMAFLIRQGYAPAATLTGYMEHTFLYAWRNLRPYIMHRRQRWQGSLEKPSRYAENLEWVVKNVCGYQDAEETGSAEVTRVPAVSANDPMSG